MEDLSAMMSQMNLLDIEKEIKIQLESIRNHPDSMKHATLLYILLHEVSMELENISTKMFVKSFDDSFNELQKKLKTEDTHLHNNISLLESMKPLPESLYSIENEISPLLKDCDNKLKLIKSQIEILPVEKIAELKKNK